jgi:hypothetical protein
MSMLPLLRQAVGESRCVVLGGEVRVSEDDVGLLSLSLDVGRGVGQNRREVTS